MVASLGFPTCSPVASISSHIVIADSLSATQLASHDNNCEDAKHVTPQQSPRGKQIDEYYARWNTPELVEVKELPASLVINDCKFVGDEGENKRLVCA